MMCETGRAKPSMAVCSNRWGRGVAATPFHSQEHGGRVAKELEGGQVEKEEEEKQDEHEEEDEDEEAFSEAYLRRISGEEDLAAVQNLSLTVDTNVTQVDHLGILMPRLTELRLERGSTLASFRDLGSSLANLRILWLSACGVRHLDGVGGLLGLEELYLAFNDVEDLTSIALHDRLEVLDLESNNVLDVEQAIQLGTCSRLWSLTLTANPICSDRHYRRKVVEAVPQLASLDEENITDDDRRPPPTPSDKGGEENAADTLEIGSENVPTPPHHPPSKSALKDHRTPGTSSQPCATTCSHLLGCADWEEGNRTPREVGLTEACSALEEEVMSLGGRAGLFAVSNAIDVGRGGANTASVATPFRARADGFLFGSSGRRRPEVLSDVDFGKRVDEEEAFCRATVPLPRADDRRNGVTSCSFATSRTSGERHGQPQTEADAGGSGVEGKVEREAMSHTKQRSLDCQSGVVEGACWGTGTDRKGEEREVKGGEEGEGGEQGRGGAEGRGGGGRGGGRGRRGGQEGCSGSWWAGGKQYHNRPSETASTATVVDEEAMVVKAIKNLRLFSITNTDTNTNKKTASTSPWRHTMAEERAIHRRSGPGCVDSEGGAIIMSTSVNGVSGTGGKTGDVGQRPRISRNGGQMADDVLAPCSENNGDNPLEARVNDGSERSGRSPESHDVWQGKGWLLEVLSLDMGTAAAVSSEQATGERRNNAASVLTHGSEVSIAGNPAFGLRRRRTPDKTENSIITNTSISSSTSASSSTRTSPIPASYSLVPTKLARCHRATNVEAAGTEATLVAPEEKEENEESPTSSTPPATTEGPTGVGLRPISAPEEKNKVSSSFSNKRVVGDATAETGKYCVDGRQRDEQHCANGESEEDEVMSDVQQLRNLHVAAGTGATEAGGVFVSPWARPCAGQSSSTAVDYDRIFGRQPRQHTTDASLFCRALLSPPSRSQQQQRLGCTDVRSRPIEGDTGDAKGPQSFASNGKVSPICSSPPATADMKAAASVCAPAEIRRRRRTAGADEGLGWRGTELGKTSVLHSRSAANFHQVPSETERSRRRELDISRSASNFHQPPLGPGETDDTANFGGHEQPENEKREISGGSRRGGMGGSVSIRLPAVGTVGTDDNSSTGDDRRRRSQSKAHNISAGQLAHGLLEGCQRKKNSFAGDLPKHVVEVPECSPTETSTTTTATTVNGDCYLDGVARGGRRNVCGGDSDSENSDSSSFRFVGDRGTRWHNERYRETSTSTYDGYGKDGGGRRQGAVHDASTSSAATVFVKCGVTGARDQEELKTPRPLVDAQSSSGLGCNEDNRHRENKSRQLRVDLGNEPLNDLDSSISRSNNNPTATDSFFSEQAAAEYPFDQERYREQTTPGRTSRAVAGHTVLSGMRGRGENVEGGGQSPVGDGTFESDERLVAMLRARPKNVPQIRTRESFRKYFRGMDRNRLRSLLREAYSDRGMEECDAKVKKRLILFERSLGTAST